MRKVFSWVFSGRGLLWFLLVWTGVLLAARSGLFQMVAPTTWEVIQSYPSKILSVICLFSALGILIRIPRSGRPTRAIYRSGQIVYLFSVITICAALWVSAYTHFEGNFIRSEGETFNAFASEYIRESMFFSSRKSLPQVGMTFRQIRPNDVNGNLQVEADVLYAGRTTDHVLEGTLSSEQYFFSDWTLIRIVDFGYSVRFSLSDLDERELESAMLPLKTYPPGAEDKFEAMFPGYQFYVQVFPGQKPADGLSAKSISLNHPAIKLRIARNKDIVYDDVISPENKVRFDNLVIAFPALSYWVKVRMLRDLGLPVVAAGALLMVVGVLLLVLGQRRVESGGPDIQQPTSID